MRIPRAAVLAPSAAVFFFCWLTKGNGLVVWILIERDAAPTGSYALLDAPCFAQRRAAADILPIDPIVIEREGQLVPRRDPV